MSLRIDTSRAPRTYLELRDLLRAVERAAAEDENEWIEWKSSLDLRAKATRATLARHILGMANRRVEESARFVQGFGYVLIGLEPGNRCGITPVDPADLRAGIASYLGPHGPRWTGGYDTEGGSPVLFIVVDPPRDGDPIYALHRDFGNYRAGDVFVRKLGSTERADPGDLDYLARRSGMGSGGTRRQVPRLTRRTAIAGIAVAAAGLSAAGWELARTSSGSNSPGSRQPGVIQPRGGTKLWSSPVRGVAISPPVAAGRSILLSTLYGGKYAYLYALRASNGSQMWSMAGRGTGEFSSPVVAGGMVYAGAENGDLYAVRAGDGTRLWSYPAGGMNIVPVASGDVVYVAGSKLIALRAADATRLWSFPAGHPALVGKVVYAPGQDGRVYALRAGDGTKIWESASLSAVAIQMVIGAALYGSSTDHVYALHADDGKLLWSFRADGGELTGVASDAGVIYVGTAISYNGEVSASTADGYLYALRAGDGKPLWRFPAKGGVYNIAASSGVVYLSTADGRIFALQARSGSVVWSFAPGGSGPAGPVEAGNRVLVSAGITSTSDNSGVSVTMPGGHVYALRGNDGKKMWSFRTGSVAGRPTAADGVVYVWSYDGNVYAIRA